MTIAPRCNDWFDTGERGSFPRGFVYLALAVAALATLPGCGGCRSDAEKALREQEKAEAEARAKKKKPPPNFVGDEKKNPPRLATRPSTRDRRDVRDRGRPPYKPGHWTAATLFAKTNNFDFVGNLEIAATTFRSSKVETIPIEGTPFDLTTSRNMSLPKRQPKVFESVLFIPASQRQAWASMKFNWRKGGQTAWQDRHPLARMPSYQYHFVVLARLPRRYTYLKLLASVKPPADEFDTGLSRPYYLVELLEAAKANRRPLLPSDGMLWTSIASVLWDDAQTDALSPQQQQAMLDWLHWGGHLIISGPDSLDSLRDSFLAPYLPAVAEGTREFDSSDFQPWHDWSGKAIPEFRPIGKFTGVKLKPDPEAQEVPHSGGLLVERRVGRGRIVVSAFPLSSRQLVAWAGWDEFFNAFLLRRGARHFDSSDHNVGLRTVWADPKHHRLDAGRICNLRYFTRDTGIDVDEHSPETKYSPDSGAWAMMPADPYATPEDTLAGGTDPLPGSGVAAWRDNGPVADSARLALRNAAQIKIPDRSFVLWVVGGYVLVLVPVNWLVFRLIGRVEWAWIAAPLIAVVCTAVVIRMAELDIGFARSRTEIAVLEIQPNYSRAHVTRYTALYTSLTTLYNFQFDPSGGLAQPFAGFTDPTQRRGLLFRRSSDATLEDYFVRSHSTGAVHCEQMVDLGGPLACRRIAKDRFELINQTKLTLHDAGVMRGHADDTVQTLWVGTIEPGQRVPLDFRPETSPGDDRASWKQRRSESVLAESMTEGGLNLSDLANLAQNQEDIEPGQMRLIAAVDEDVPGPTIDPPAPASQAAALVVAHLRYGFGEDPKADKNLMPKSADPVSPNSESLEIPLEQPDPNVGMPLSGAPATIPLESLTSNP